MRLARFVMCAKALFTSRTRADAFLRQRILMSRTRADAFLRQLRVARLPFP